MSDMGALERLKTVAPEPENTDGGLGADIVWAVAEIERLRAERDAWHAACRFIYDATVDSNQHGRPIDCFDNRTWTRVVELIAAAEATGGERCVS